MMTFQLTHQGEATELGTGYGHVAAQGPTAWCHAKRGPGCPGRWTPGPWGQDNWSRSSWKCCIALRFSRVPPWRLRYLELAPAG